jgi:DNA-binding GntR family transcriptional regulator
MTVKTRKTAIERRSLAEQVFEHVKMMILSRQYEGGQRVPEERIVQELGVSRTPVREAMRRLSEHGLIALKPRSYAEVITVSTGEAEKITKLREQLENLAVSEAAECANEEALGRLQAINEEFKSELAAKDMGRALELDSRFHLAIAAAGDNTHLLEMMRKLDAKVQLCRLGKKYVGLTQSAREHDRLIELLSKQDAKGAIELMHTHVWRAV